MGSVTWLSSSDEYCGSCLTMTLRLGAFPPRPRRVAGGAATVTAAELPPARRASPTIYNPELSIIQSSLYDSAQFL